MSHLDEFKTKFTDKEALVRGLCRMGFARHQIECHTKAQAILGYHGTEDNKVGHVIIRKAHTDIPSDIGWELKDGTYVGHVDSYHYSGRTICYDQKWSMKLTESYNFELSKMTFEARGIKVQECKDSRGRLQLRAKMMQNNKMKVHI